MSRVLVVLHTEAEPLGALEAPLADAGLRVETQIAPDGLPRSMSGYAGLVVMGGSMGAYELDTYPYLRNELQLLRAALADETPILGVCLGSQLLAAAAGARVFRGPLAEVGWLPVRRTGEDPWLAGWPRTLEPLHLHHDTFELPTGAVLLASSAAYVRQAFRVGSGLGLQFHVEVTAEMARHWLGAGLPAGWHAPAGHLDRCERSAERMLPLATALARQFASAVRARAARG